MLISSVYLPPTWYFSKIISEESVLIESYEHFVKQTIRNRCHILSPNGVQMLVVPVEHHGRTVTPMRDIRIANGIPWQRQHFRSLESAYRRSAYFEFYQDDFLPFYEKPFDFLLDFNMELLRLLLELVGMKPEISFTKEYHPTYSGADMRSACDTGIPVVDEHEPGYPQVFGYKNGFVAGLSIVDLLFNVGPGSVEYLRKLKS